LHSFPTRRSSDLGEWLKKALTPRDKFLCELALGLGKTLDEIRQMPESDVGMWRAYVEENGPLNLALRIEAAVARVAAPFFNNVKPRQLMPWPREPEPELDAQAMAAALYGTFSGLAKQTQSSRKR